MKTSNQVETIHRAKVKNSKEFKEGMLGQYDSGEKWIRPINNTGISCKCDSKWFDIEEETLAIHFTNSNMNDSDGSPIFASLSEDGNGGSSLDRFNNGTYYDSILVKIRDINHLDWDSSNYDMPDLTTKVTGIHTVKEES